MKPLFSYIFLELHGYLERISRSITNMFLIESLFN